MYLKKGKALVAIVLVILMAFLLPVQVFAQTLPEPETPESVSFGSMNDVTTANIVSEIEDRRDETTKHFRMDDGTIMAVSYGSPVHFKNSKGKWVEYNNSLIADESTLNEATADEAVFGFVNKKSDIDIKVAPDSRNEKMIHIGAKKGDISWKYSGAKLSNAKIKNNNKKYKGNEKFTNVDKMTSTAKYENIYENVDLECIVSPTGVKENLILENKDAKNEFEIVYDIKGLTAKQVDDKTIQLYNEKNKKTYKITAPYMYDAEKNISEDLSLEIISNKNNKLTVKLVADKSFLNGWGRQYPVTIDPEVIIEGNPGIMTAQVCKNTPQKPEYQGTHFYVGMRNGKEYCGLVKSEGIEDSYVDKNVVSAKVKVFTTDVTSEMEINAYAITDSTASWTYQTATYNMLTLSDDVIDYETLELGGEAPAVFDITKTFKQWCRGDVENNGILIESDEAFTDFGGYAYYYDSAIPRIEVIYKEYNGSESNLTKHTVSTGQNAELSVVDSTGDLVVKQNVYNESGSRFPMSLYATYHGTENTLYDNIGYGWRMSYDKTLTLSNGYYIYEDDDGVNTYFKAEANSIELYDEDELGYTLKINDSSITVDDGSVIYTFDVVTEGEISKIKSEKDIDNSENAITYTYNSENLLTTITSTFGTYTINYTTSSTDSTKKWITNIVLPDSSRIYYVYYGGTNKLSRIKFNDGLSSYFYYNSYADEGLLSGVCHRGISNEYGHKVLCTYNSNNQVTKITEYDYDTSTSTHVAGDYLNISYGNDNTTIFTDKNGRSETYIFDEYGNTISVLNANGYSEDTGSSGLSISEGSASYTKNYIDVSSEPEGIGSSYYYQKVNGVIASENSSGGKVTVDSTTSYLGSKSLKIKHSADAQFFTYARHTSPVGDFAGKTMTFSTYVKVSDIVEGNRGGLTGAFMKLKCVNASGTTILDKNSVAITTSLSDSEWQRISLTATFPEETSTYRLFVALRNVQGSAWFDCLQLEEGEVMNDYNALSNSDFTTTDSWYNQDASAITLNSNGDVEIQGIGGEPAESAAEGTTDEEIVANKYVYQTIPVNKANISFNISGTASAKSVPLNNEYRTFGISAKIKYKGDTTFTEEHYKEFNCATTIDQNVSLAVYPYNENKVINEVAFAFVYGYNKNRMIVKNAMLNVNIDYDIDKQIELLDEMRQDMIDEYNSAEYNNLSKPSDHKILCIKCENVTCNGETYSFNNKIDDIFDEAIVNFEKSVESFACNNVNILIDTEVISDEIVCNSNYLEYEKVEDYIKAFSTIYEYDAVLVFCANVEDEDYNLGTASKQYFDPVTGFGYCCINIRDVIENTTGGGNPINYPYLEATNVMIHEWLHTLEAFRSLGIEYPNTHGYQKEYSENDNSRIRNDNASLNSSVISCSYEDIFGNENIQTVDVATIYENEEVLSSYSGQNMLTNDYYSWPEYVSDGLEPEYTNFYKAVLRAEVYDISEERNVGMYPTFWEVRQRDCFFGRYKIQESISENYLYYVNDTTIGNSQSFVDNNTYRWNLVYNLFAGGVSIISAYDTSRRFDIDNLVVSPDCLKLWRSTGYYQAQSFDLVKNNNETYSFLCKISNYTDYYMCLDNTLGFSKNSEYNKWNLILE